MTPYHKEQLQRLANLFETAAREEDWSVLFGHATEIYEIERQTSERQEEHLNCQMGATTEGRSDPSTHQSNNGGANGVSDPNKYLNKDSFEAYPELDAIEIYLDDERGR